MSLESTSSPPRPLDDSRPDEFLAFGDLEKLAHDDLLDLARELGLPKNEKLSSKDLRRKIRKRIDVLKAIDPEAMEDVLRWAHQPVPRNATRMALAREIRGVKRLDYDTLSHRGLVAMARLRNIPVADEDHAEQIIAKLNEAEGFWGKVDRQRRRIIGRLLEKVIDMPDESDAEKARTEAENAAARERRLHREIESHGVVGGIASRIRGAADSYIEAKLDEIELRIDAKLAQIDLRLAEWRDREIANRLKILRITLAFTLLVALLSLGYNLAKNRFTTQPKNETSTEQVERNFGRISTVESTDSTPKTN